MDAKSSSIKFAKLISILSGIVISLTLFTDTYAARGCCSKHGGVASCNTYTGYLKCKDGTQSPTCKCSGETSKPTKAKPTYQYKSTTEPLPPPILSAPTSPSNKPASTRGCCRGHGGVTGCDSKTGYQKCKDGTLSPSCRC